MVVFGQVANLDVLANKFELKGSKSTVWKKLYNINQQHEARAITMEHPKEIRMLHYGMVPFWSKLNKLHFEAPIDGDKSGMLRAHQLKKRIIQSREFKAPIQQSRCLIPVDYFILIENNFATLFFTKRPFALAGVYDTWKFHPNDKAYTGFALLSLPAAGIIEAAQYRRQPFMIPQHLWRMWLNPSSRLMNLTDAMDYYPDPDLNGYLIDLKTIKSQENTRKVINPLGPLLATNIQERHHNFSEKIIAMKKRRRAF